MKHCSRNVVCYVIDPLSVLSYVGLRLTAVGGGTALRFLPERHIWCAGWRVAKIQELEQSQKPDVPEGKRVDLRSAAIAHVWLDHQEAVHAEEQ